jgi:hypothetical protein
MIILQYIIILIVAAFSVYYLYKKIRAELASDSCETGCGKCAMAKSFDKING